MRKFFFLYFKSTGNVEIFASNFLVYIYIDITKEIRATLRLFTFVSYFGYRLILIFSAILSCVTNQKVEKSQRSSDLLCNIRNCIPRS